MTREEAISKLNELIECTVDRGMIDDICYEVIEFLKALEPRVMMLEEVTAAMKVPVWKETKNGKTLYQGWVLTYDIQKGQGITGTRLGIAEPSGRVVWYKIEDYGKTWLLWTAEPTDEQRRATPWE